VCALRSRSHPLHAFAYILYLLFFLQANLKWPFERRADLHHVLAVSNEGLRRAFYRQGMIEIYGASLLIEGAQTAIWLCH